MLFTAPIRLHTQPRWYQCEPQWHWAPPALVDFDLWFVAAGRGELRLEGQRFELRSGVCFVLRPGARPLATHDAQNPLVVFACHFWPEQENRDEIVWPDGLAVRDMAFFLACANRTAKLWRRGDEFGQLHARLGVESLLNLLWDEAWQSAPSVLDLAFEELVEEIRREPGRKWTLDLMAKRLHLSRAQVVRRFHGALGVSPIQFVIETRLERARELLRETNLTLEQIAMALGYSNAPFFARQFKQFCGQTPGEWRRGR